MKKMKTEPVQLVAYHHQRKFPQKLARLRRYELLKYSLCPLQSLAAYERQFELKVDEEMRSSSLGLKKGIVFDRRRSPNRSRAVRRKQWEASEEAYDAYSSDGSYFECFVCIG